MWIRSTMTYRLSFALTLFTSFCVTFFDFVVILLMFGRVEGLGGFSFAEVAFLYGTAGTAFGIADLTMGSLQRMGKRVRDGSLDTFLMRPAPLLAQVAADKFALRRFGRVAQALLVLVWSLVLLDVAWTPVKVVLLPVTVVCGAVIFGAVMVIGASALFWIQDAAEVTNSFTYGGNTLLQYPPSIFAQELVRGSCTVPLAFVSWLPALYVLGRPAPAGCRTGRRSRRPRWRSSAAGSRASPGGRGSARTDRREAEDSGMSSTEPFIHLDGVEKTFTVRRRAGLVRREKREVRAVDGISFGVERGEMVGYIGPNGAGKSTTIKMLTGILTPSGGRLRVAGIDPSRERTRLARRIGVVFGQRTTLWWDLPLRDSYALMHRMYRIPDARYRENLGRCVELLDLGSCSTCRCGSSRWASGCAATSRRRCCTTRRCCTWTSRRSAWTWCRRRRCGSS